MFSNSGWYSGFAALFNCSMDVTFGLVVISTEPPGISIAPAYSMLLALAR